MNFEDKDMSEIIESDFDEADKKNWMVWVFTILCIAIGTAVLIKFIPAIIASDDAVTEESIEDIVEFPVYYVENMDTGAFMCNQILRELFYWLKRYLVHLQSILHMMSLILVGNHI